MSEDSVNATRIDEIADGIYRISTGVGLEAIPGGFSFNQYLIVDEDPLLFHTGPRGMFPAVRDAIARVMPVDRLRWIAFSHVEADECGSLNDFLAAAPRSQPLCSAVAAMTSANDLANRPARAMADRETMPLGRHSVVWWDAAHVPHGWECGFLSESTTRTLLCGDLFTQPGARNPAVTEDDILGPSETMRRAMDYFAHGPSTRPVLEKLARTEPVTLACMHGSAWRGDGAGLLRALADALQRAP